MDFITISRKILASSWPGLIIASQADYLWWTLKKSNFSGGWPATKCTDQVGFCSSSFACTHVPFYVHFSLITHLGCFLGFPIVFPQHRTVLLMSILYL